ncbi:hypothetical protein DFH11DRAFT_1877042 [Phellopilus nigrolimitatus]|nr:hypothetical protein DFH11DRAFT_1877042 [Phellopilus nigrolimitatus]
MTESGEWASASSHLDDMLMGVAVIKALCIVETNLKFEGYESYDTAAMRLPTGTWKAYLRQWSRKCDAYQKRGRRLSEKGRASSVLTTLPRSFSLPAKTVQARLIFVNDSGDAPTLQALHDVGVRTIALRVHLEKAAELGIAVVRVPAYSPEAIAEFTIGMILTVVRKYHKVYNRVREGNFLLFGLVGLSLSGKTVGTIGTGKIGMLTGKISRTRLLARADVFSLHCPLGAETLACTKRGVMLANTSGGGGVLVKTAALVRLLKNGHVGAVAVALDVRLLSFHKCLRDWAPGGAPLPPVADMTIQNLSDLEEGKECQNIVNA